MAMTNEEIDKEIARLTKLKEQNNQAQTAESARPATGIYNPADYVGKIADNMNKSHYSSGDKFSNNLNVAKDAGKRSSKTEDMFGNPLPGTAYEYITQMLNSERAKGPVNKHTLRMIENAAKLYYNMPSKFDISGKGWFNNTDSKMAKAMNSMAYSGKPQTPVQNTQSQQPSQSPQTPVQNTQSQQPSQSPQTPVQAPKSIQGTQSQDISPKVKLDDERTAAYKRIKAKQASEADLALFRNYTEEELKKIGFKTLSIEAIKGATRQVQSGSVLTDDDKQFMKQYARAAGSRRSTDRKFLTSENIKRHDALIKAQNEAKKSSNSGLTNDDVEFMNKYKQYTQQLSGSQPRNAADLKVMQESEARKFITDKANVERYKKLSRVQ